MPSLAIQSIDTSNGLKVVCGSGLPSIERDGAVIVAAPGNLKQKEKALNDWLQAQYERRWLLTDLDPNERHRQDPPILLPNERIESGYLIVTQMYTHVTIESLSPLRLTPTFSKEPIV